MGPEDLPKEQGKQQHMVLPRTRRCPLEIVGENKLPKIGLEEQLKRAPAEDGTETGPPVTGGPDSESTNLVDPQVGGGEPGSTEVPSPRGEP